MKVAIQSTLEILNPEQCEAIVTVAEFQPASGPVRHYLNLRHAERSFRGDQNTKLWIDDRGVLIHQVGKGTTSYLFREDRDEVLAHAERNGVTIEKRS